MLVRPPYAFPAGFPSCAEPAHPVLHRSKVTPMLLRSRFLHCLTALAALALSAALAQAQSPRRPAPAPGARPPASPAGAPQTGFKGIWEPVNYKQDIKLTDVYFVSATTGWVTGEHGTLLKTTDGGDTWDAVLGGDPAAPEQAIRALRFLDATHGWAVQGTDKLLRTADGENWEQAGRLGDTYGYFHDFAFLSDQVGVQIVKQHNELERTQDGGKTWKVIQNSCEVDAEVQGLTRKLGCSLKSLLFLSPTNGYAIGSTTPGTNMVLFRTGDGGMSWTPQLVPDVARDDESYFWQGIAFVDENRGFAMLPHGERFLGTSDGGQTWHGVIGSVRGPLKFADPEVGWSIQDKRLTYTVDGGSRWSSVVLPFPGEVSAFSLPRRNAAFAVGAHGMIYRYRVVPVAYSSAGMIASPLMPAVDGVLAAEAGQLQAQVAVVQAAVSNAQGAAVAGSDSSLVDACCAAQVQKLETLVGQVAVETPKFTSKYRSLNLLLAGLQFARDLFGNAEGLKESLKALRHGKDLPSIAAALTQLSAQADSVAMRVKTVRGANR